MWQCHRFLRLSLSQQVCNNSLSSSFIVLVCRKSATSSTLPTPDAVAGGTDAAPPTGGSGAPVAAKPADVVIRAADVKSIQSEFGSHSYAVEEEVRSLHCVMFL